MVENKFDILEALDEIPPESKHKYVKCNFYNKNFNKSAFIRADTKLFKHKIVELKHETMCGYASIKEVQLHPVNEKLIHVDFFVIDSSYDAVRTMVPLKFINLDQAPGIKLGGLLYKTSRCVEVATSFKSIVPYIEVDATGMKVEDSVKIKNVKIPEGVEVIRKDLTVATLLKAGAN
jgi:ribosomal protein bL25 (Ctc-form)